MSDEPSPRRWAADLTKLLNAAFAEDRFPVRVSTLAKEFSHQRYPADPIMRILGEALPGFEGALLPAQGGGKGWGIIYNNAIRSKGRINFTLAHEFGHYLIHRLKYPDGINCTQEDMATWDSEYRQIESQANDFAASLLMPFDDFRKQIGAKSAPDLDKLGSCAKRYEVSLIASILRWLQYTERRSLLVVSRDDFILWARSSDSAFRSGAFIKTAGQPPVPIPPGSLAAQRHLAGRSTGDIELDAGVWFNEPCREQTRFSEQYDFSISLLHLGDHSGRQEIEEEPYEDTFDRIANRTPGSSWLG